MRRIILATALLLVASSFVVPSAAQSTTHPPQLGMIDIDPACWGSPSISPHRFEALAARVYSGMKRTSYARRKPLRDAVRCVKRVNLHAVHRIWTEQAIAQQRRRHHAWFIDTYEPYSGVVGGAGWPNHYGHFAVPTCIVDAESHGLVDEHSDPDGSSGEYQIEESTWVAEGGTQFAAYPYQASHDDQSEIASRIWDHGHHASQWSTAAGCGYYDT